MKTIELLEKVDHIKSNWFEWAALRNEPDGSQTEGTVQADGSGDMIAEESFTPNAVREPSRTHDVKQPET